jgi:hypothetical protein
MATRASAIIDRYPGKMVGHLAERIVSCYGKGAKSLLDPFCGSGAILSAAQNTGIEVVGMDVNPIAVLLSSIKLNGFRLAAAEQKLTKVLDLSRSDKYRLPIVWPLKTYWFTPSTIRKFEFLRGAAYHLDLGASQAGRAILLAIALAARPCSRADQRSPKPFISRTAIETRKGRHFDPIRKTREIFELLAAAYGKENKNKAKVRWADSARPAGVHADLGQFTHVMTSPPYINAQDYFRNWKIELYLLEGLLPFTTDALRPTFVGTESGVCCPSVGSVEWTQHVRIAPVLADLSCTDPQSAAVVHKYLEDMKSWVGFMRRVLQRDGTLVVVCGDNLIGGYRVATWEILNKLIANEGFTLVDMFADPIRFRQLAPKRCGHKGLIKQEVVSVFSKGPSDKSSGY